MTSQTNILYYVHDPMCSWCWAFAPVWQQVQAELKQLPVQVEYLLGGLAPDSSEPMPPEMQQMLQDTWRRIQQHVPGTEFNFAFWTDCQPRRSTWPACRAVLAAAKQDSEREMIAALQRAYYLRAMNPSDDATSLQLAQELGLDVERFARDLNSAELHRQLQQHIGQAQSLPINGFPSLVLCSGNEQLPIQLDYNNAASMVQQIKDGLKA